MIPQHQLDTLEDPAMKPAEHNFVFPHCQKEKLDDIQIIIVECIFMNTSTKCLVKSWTKQFNFFFG